MRLEATEILSQLPVSLRGAYRLWQSCLSQLRVIGETPIGLDYNAVSLVAKLIDVDLDEYTFEGLQVAESEYVMVWIEDEEKRQKEREASRSTGGQAWQTRS